jgi:hypothetical protein
MASHPSRRPIVILGAPRSGTTLLRRLLNQHPVLHCPGETFLLTAAARFLQEDLVADGLRYGVAGGLAELGVDEARLHSDLFALVDRYMSDAARAAGKTRWVMKTAIDSFHVRNVEAVCGDRVAYIVILRHALDVIASLAELCEANRMFIRELHAYVVRTPYPDLAFANAWKDVTESLLDLSERRRDDVYLCRYEELVQSPQSVVDAMLEFLGEATVPDVAQGLREDTPSGIGDWKTYSSTTIEAGRANQWRSRSGGVRDAVAATVNDTLERAGYQRLGVVPTDSEAARRRYDLLTRLNAARARSAEE